MESKDGKLLSKPGKFIKRKTIDCTKIQNSRLPRPLCVPFLKRSTKGTRTGTSHGPKGHVSTEEVVV